MASNSWNKSNNQSLESWEGTVLQLQMVVQVNRVPHFFVLTFILGLVYIHDISTDQIEVLVQASPTYSLSNSSLPAHIHEVTWIIADAVIHNLVLSPNATLAFFGNVSDVLSSLVMIFNELALLSVCH